MERDDDTEDAGLEGNRLGGCWFEEEYQFRGRGLGKCWFGGYIGLQDEDLGRDGGLGRGATLEDIVLVSLEDEDSGRGVILKDAGLERGVGVVGMMV